MLAHWNHNSWASPRNKSREEREEKEGEEEREKEGRRGEEREKEGRRREQNIRTNIGGPRLLVEEERRGGGEEEFGGEKQERRRGGEEGRRRGERGERGEKRSLLIFPQLEPVTPAAAALTNLFTQTSTAPPSFSNPGRQTLEFGFPTCCYDDLGLGPAFFYLMVYGVIGGISAVLILVKSFLLAQAGINASQSVCYFFCSFFPALFRFFWFFFRVACFFI
jgi:hypothetical protein